ncbi:Hypothetical protein AKI40_2824 [Enterobacter sp. FY-07]|uniref:DUF2612 domain-containing protein n=1 Tax=Kosakonia oryzendophytica TaxID=1005665 RepID=UPI00077813FC|nr:DUF2612 domain-containing protein [Kosakonia oryzendophytica]AMO49212.1 Hypothetical protein AKI40_2824 [Enterobacter sp. FY-07]WBT56325.1 DUF2612 domain-containing protein [Kosakonia oryzendophytica]
MQHRNKALTRAYWQYKNAPKLIALLLALPDIAQASIEDQLAKIQVMLDIDSAEGEQLDICGRIAGYTKRPVGTFYPVCVPSAVSDDLFRRMIKAKIFKNNSIATIDDIKRASDYILNTAARILDGQDMTMRPVFFEYLDVGSQKLVADYDLIPRPQGVGMKPARTLTYRPFGFGQHYNNFRAPFWHGDGVKFYANLQLVLTWSGDVVSGTLTANPGVSVSDIDVTLIYTASGASTNQSAITDTEGRFTVTPPVAEPFSVIARAQVWTPLCEWEDVESAEVTTNIFHNGSVTHNGLHTHRG